MSGTWISQNKVRPGAYIKFTAVEQPDVSVGDRGIGTMAIPLDWGPEGELIDVYSTDLTDGSSLAKIGLTAFDAGAKLLNLMLSNCYLAKIYRLNSGGVKATATQGDLTVTAKYSGTLGNEITVQVAEADGAYEVTTYVSGTSRDTQTVADIQELEENDYVTFKGTGVPEVHAGIVLTGGTNGSASPATAYPAYMEQARKAQWQTMALTQDGQAFNSQFAAFADQMRNDEGKYVQVVLANYPAADSISVINSDCGAVVDGVTVTAEEATAWVAGVTAGASVVQSNVAAVFTGATQILNERTNSEIIEDSQKGMFILSTNQRGEIVVENDINSLHTFTSELSSDMRLNQVVRVLDDIGTTTADTWEQSFKGKVQNNSKGRDVFKSTMLTYFNELENLGAIEEFAGADDITVEQGTAKDAVAVDVAVKPVAAMSKLYMTVYVS